jgi:hypothetical protein
MVRRKQWAVDEARSVASSKLTVRLVSGGIHRPERARAHRLGDVVRDLNTVELPDDGDVPRILTDLFSRRVTARCFMRRAAEGVGGRVRACLRRSGVDRRGGVRAGVDTARMRGCRPLAVATRLTCPMPSGR